MSASDPRPDQVAAIDGDGQARPSFEAPVHHGTGDINQAQGNIYIGEAPAPGMPVPQQLPRDIRAFTGRTEHLEALDEILGPDAPVLEPLAIASITGPPGAGKTALAVHWAHRVRARFPDGQFYVNLRGFGPGPALAAADVLARFVSALDVPRDRIPADLDELTALFRSLLADRKVLIVLDNCAGAEQVRPLIPSAPGCLVLVTSRRSLSGLVALDDARPVLVGVMKPTESVTLLSNVLGLDRVRESPQAAEELARLCAHLPLALRLVAARAAREDYASLTDLVSELSDTARRLDLMAADDEPDAAVRVAFSWSYCKLADAEARLFRRLGLHAGSEPGLAAAAALADTDAAVVREWLGHLAGMHLIEQLGHARYEMHDLLRLYAAERAELEETGPERAGALDRMLGWYLNAAARADESLFPQRRHVELELPQASYPSPSFSSREEALTWCEDERANLTAAVLQAFETGRDGIAWRLPVALGGFFNLRTHWTDWVHTHQIALQAARRLPDRFGEAWVLNNLGNAYHNFQQPAESRECYEQALRIRRAIGDVPGAAISLLNRGSAFERNAQFDSALRDLDEALEAFRQIGDQYGEGMALNNIANVYRQVGQLTWALEYATSALELRRATADQQGEAITLTNIAEIHVAAGDHDRAAEHFRLALELRRKVGDLQGEAGTLYRWGSACSGWGKRSEARRCWELALAIFDRIDDPQADELRPLLDGLGRDRSSAASD